ncbi:MAG: hypothetical protein HYY76_09285 [Acidobacteria bacterium]|nr:hypothetical protein [Acidobacteriota bacterium]
MNHEDTKVTKNTNVWTLVSFGNFVAFIAGFAVELVRLSALFVSVAVALEPALLRALGDGPGRIHPLPVELGERHRSPPEAV